MAKWQPHEIEYVKQHLWNKSYLEMGQVLNRSSDSVRNYIDGNKLRKIVPKPRRAITEEERNKLRFFIGYLTSRDYNSF